MPSSERDHYPRAIVPDHMTTRRLKNLPIETPVLVPLLKKDGNHHFLRPTIFITDDMALHARESTELTKKHFDPIKTPMGRVGLMRVAIIGNRVGDATIRDEVRDGVVADLRFINRSLPEIGSDEPDDPDDAQEWLDQYADSIPVDAFIANDPDNNNGSYYGPEVLYPALDRLRERDDLLMQRFAKNQLKKKARTRRKANKSSDALPARDSDATIL